MSYAEQALEELENSNDTDNPYESVFLEFPFHPVMDGVEYIEDDGAKAEFRIDDCTRCVFKDNSSLLCNSSSEGWQLDEETFKIEDYLDRLSEQEADQVRQSVYILNA